MVEVIPFSEEQLRISVNMAQHYDVWMSAERSLASLPYGMKWAQRGDKEYLYEVLDRAGNNKSLGRRSAETEEVMSRYQEDKAALKERIDFSKATLNATGRVYRALRMPMVSSEAARILREADKREMLGTTLMVIGTNAMPAYSIEAGGRISAPDETDDFDMAWAAKTDSEGPSILAMLKAVDSTYTMNTEREFQARNAKAHEFELLAAPSTVGHMLPNDRPRPIALPEQEWLLMGRPVSHVVTARDGSPARIVAPDPRWFALQKIWMSRQEKRSRLKRPKDLKQGNALLEAVSVSMPHYPLDVGFRAELPDELQPLFDEWRSSQDHELKAAPDW